MNSFVKMLTCAGLGALLCIPAVQAPDAAAAEASAPVVTLKGSIESMLKNNHSLRSMQESREAAAHDVTRAKAGFGPRVDMVVRAGVGKLTDNTTRAYDYNDLRGHSSASLLLTQPVWDGWLTRGRYREALATLESMDYRVLDNATSLALDAIIAHVDVLRRKAILDYAAAYVSRHEEILDKARDRERLGVDTMADVSQAQSRLARARSTLADAKASLRIGEENYTRLTKRPARNLGPVALPAEMYAGADDVIALAEQGNPKVSAYLHDLKASRARKEQARAAYMPSFSVEMGPSYSDRDGKNELWTAEFDVSGVMRWNIFNSGADVAANKAAAARVRQTRQGLYDFMDELTLSVEESFANLRSAQEQHAFYSEAVDHNKRTRKAYEEQFILGQRSLLDVLDAESELFNSSTQAATAFANCLVAAYKLQGLTGELLPKLGFDTEDLKKLEADNEPLDAVRVRSGK